jgi:hypothetical protein
MLLLNGRSGVRDSVITDSIKAWVEFLAVDNSRYGRVEYLISKCQAGSGLIPG